MNGAHYLMFIIGCCFVFIVYTINIQCYRHYIDYITRALKCKTLGYVPQKNSTHFSSTVELKLYSTE